MDKGKKEHEGNIVEEREIDKEVRNIGEKNTGKEIAVELLKWKEEKKWIKEMEEIETLSGNIRETRSKQRQTDKLVLKGKGWMLVREWEWSIEQLERNEER